MNGEIFNDIYILITNYLLVRDESELESRKFEVIAISKFLAKKQKSVHNLI